MKKTFVTLTGILTFAMIFILGSFMVSASDFEGSGTAEDPYLIHNESELCDMIEESKNDSFQGVHFRLTANIEVEYDGIGSSDCPFGGVFDGNGKTVLFINNDINGMFECIQNATIRNLYVEADFEITRTMRNVLYAGGIAAYATGENTIENCIFSGTLTNKKTTSNYTAGILGYAEGTVNINRCSCEGIISGSGNYVAGILGYAETGSDVTLTDCMNKAMVSGKEYVSGIAACMINSKFTVNHCVNANRISGTGNCSGILNFNNDSPVASMRILNALNLGTVSAVEGSGYAGGILACSYTNGTNCSIENCANNGTISGNDMLGGIAAYWSSRAGEILTMKNCYNSGEILGTGAGALIGYYDKRTSDVITGNYYDASKCSKLDSKGNLTEKNGNAVASNGDVQAVITGLNANITDGSEWKKWTLPQNGMYGEQIPVGEICFEIDLENGLKTSSVLSEGSLWLIIVIAVSAVAAVAVLVMLKKKKEGANTGSN